MKSFWKFAFTNRQILDFFFKSKKRFHIKNYDIVINLIKNEGRIMLGFLGISVWMDNGSKNLDSFIVKKNKLGFNFQDFLNTKIEGSSIHRRKKKKKKRRKGHIVNSWGNRLYFHGSWKDSWIVKNIYHSYFLHNLLDIRKILENLFTWKSVRNHGISLSHIKFFQKI